MPLSFAAETPAPQTPCRILVADDDPVGRSGTVRQLAALGFAADVAGDGEEVLEALVQKAYDVIFMDCQMPRLDGYGATQRIRQWNGGFEQPVIIALTALVTELNRRRCLRAGMDDYLSKPAQAEELSRCLARWMPQQSGEGDTEEDREERDAGETKLMQLFLMDAPQRLAAMRAALDTRDALALENAAHTLKGGSGIIGATDLSRRCDVLETLGEFGLFEQAERELSECEAEFDRVRLDLEEKIAALEAGL